MKLALLLLGCSLSAFGAACTMQTINGSDIQNTSPAKLNANFTCLNNNAPKIFSGAIVPGVVTGSRFGDFYLNTGNGFTYQCFAVSPPCNAVGNGNWTLLGSSGGGAIPNTTNALRGSGGGGATAVGGSPTDCVLVNGSSASCGGAGSGNVVGPSSATGDALARYDGTTGKLLKNSGATVDNSGNVSANSFAGTDASHSGGANFKGLTSGAVMLAAADIAGTAIVYVLPSTNGTAGQVLEDNGVIACPTLATGSPSVCHQLTWASISGGGITPTARGNYSSATACSGAITGQLYFATDTPGVTRQCNGTTYQDFMNDEPITVPGAASGWTAVNSPTLTDAGGAILFSKSTDTLGLGLKVTGGATDFQVKFKMISANGTAVASECGLWITDGTTAGTSVAHGVTIGEYDSGTIAQYFGINQRSYSPINGSITGFGSGSANAPQISDTFTLRITVVGGTAFTTYTGDGHNWSQVGTGTVSGITHYGFGCDPRGANPTVMKVFSMSAQ